MTTGHDVGLQGKRPHNMELQGTLEFYKSVHRWSQREGEREEDTWERSLSQKSYEFRKADFFLSPPAVNQPNRVKLAVGVCIANKIVTRS